MKQYLRNIRTYTQQDGMTLLITLLLMGVLLGISASLLNITIKQFQLSGIAYSSERAFQAAAAGIECARYWDGETHPFDIGSNRGHTIKCFGSGDISDSVTDSNNNGKVDSQEEQRFEFTWSNHLKDSSANDGGSAMCTKVSVYKFSSINATPLVVEGINRRPTKDCPKDGLCTVILSRGYNVPCDTIQTAGRVMEREYTVAY